MSDPTMDNISLNGSVKWAAARIGWPLTRFKQKREILEQDGFPTIDRLTNLYVKADVDAWVNRQRQLSANIVFTGSAQHPAQEVDFGAL